MVDLFASSARVAGATLLSALAQCAQSASAEPKGASKGEYLDIMAAAVGAYSDEHMARYLAEAERDGVQEHGFPRLAANLGVLVANGRLPEKREVFTRMMTACCRDARKGMMPPKQGGNEFSVKELAIALDAVEKAGVFGKSVTDSWRADLSAIDPWRSYTCRPTPVGSCRMAPDRTPPERGRTGASATGAGSAGSGKTASRRSFTARGPLALTLPAFDFDGEGSTEIACDGRALSVSYKGWTCRYSTDGEIVDMDAPVSNRNGRYRVFEARGRDSLKVRISIFPEKTTSKTRGANNDYGGAAGGGMDIRREARPSGGCGRSSFRLSVRDADGLS